MVQFEYVMVLVSIVVGLGIAHILLGISGIIDRLSTPGRIWQYRNGGGLIHESYGRN